MVSFSLISDQPTFTHRIVTGGWIEYSLTLHLLNTFIRLYFTLECIRSEGRRCLHVKASVSIATLVFLCVCVCVEELVTHR